MLGILLAVLTVCSLLFLALFVTAYRGRLLDGHARASMQVNRLLEATLKNAMLKRDIPGLRAIVGELGEHPEIDSVFILNPDGDVRFSSKPGGAVPEGPIDASRPSAQFVSGIAGREVMRTVNPVHNEARCHGCHGSAADHPVNGILVVDYVAGDIRSEAWRGALLMGFAGAAVLLAALGAVAFMLNRRVLRPLGALSAVAGRFAEGSLHERVDLPGRDEVAELGHRFNAMASSLDTMLHSVRASETFLQELIDAMPDGVRVIGRDYRILKVNAAYCRQLGIAADAAIGAPCYASSHGLDAPCSPLLVNCPLEELGPARSTLKCRHRHVRHDGGEVFVEVSAASAAIERDGIAVDCVIESIRDMAEQAAVSHQHRLSEIGQFAAGIAHEIHNPLSSIHLALGAIRADGAAARGDAGFAEYLAIADREIDRCLEVTGRLLRISEPAGVEVALLDVAQIAADVAALVHYQAEKAGVAIDIEAQGRPRVLANDSDLGIVILNIVQNAIHAMPRGGRITLSLRGDGRMVHIDCEDQGIGIPADDLKRIFWPFWSRRADGSIGSGLGLSIVRAAVERMGGRISVESAVGIGTAIRIEVPDADAGDASQ